MTTSATRVRSTRTLASVLDPRRNSLNALRLGLALLVVVSHAWPLNGWDGEPAFGGLTLGAWAVLGFFGISGYLITVSRLSSRPVVQFWTARALRIFPGLLVSLALVAFVAAPVAAAAQDGASWSPVHAVKYFLRNAFLYPYGVYQNSIDGTLIGFEHRDWNGPLWTLFWEGVCYLLIGVGVTVLGRRRRLVAGLAIAIAIAVLAAVSHRFDDNLGGLGARVISMMLAFAVGALLAVLRDRVPVNMWSIPAVVLLAAVVIGTGRAGSFAALLVPFIMLVLGAVLPLRRIGSRVDLSYGVYIYAWPVQQLFVLHFGPRRSLVLMLLLVISSTVVLAALSFLLVEQPAMRARGATVVAVTRVLHAVPHRARATRRAAGPALLVAPARPRIEAMPDARLVAAPGGSGAAPVEDALALPAPVADPLLVPAERSDRWARPARRR